METVIFLQTFYKYYTEEISFHINMSIACKLRLKTNTKLLIFKKTLKWKYKMYLVIIYCEFITICGIPIFVDLVDSIKQLY